MPQLDELLDASDPAWPLINSWIAASVRSIDVAPANRKQGGAVLLALQVTTHSALGAVALETGGIFIDHGWLRFLGSGGLRMQGDLLLWNGLGNRTQVTPLDGVFVVAHDVIGGFFALNGGAWKHGKLGGVFYLPPDRLEWEGLDLGYTDFLRWACLGGLDGFYSSVRWPGWHEDVALLDGDHGFLIWPPLVSKGLPIAERMRRTVPQQELWEFMLDVARQTKNLPPGATIRFQVDPPARS